MFLSTSSMRSLIQNENADNAGFKKPGALKSTSSQLRTPFKDRSVNSISPSSRYNRQVMQKKDCEGSAKKTFKNDTCVKLDSSEMRKEQNDIFLNDYASFKEIPDKFEDIYPSLDILTFLNKYVSGTSPKYIPDDRDDIDNFVEIPNPNIEIRYSSFPSTFDVNDVPLPIFNY